MMESFTGVSRGPPGGVVIGLRLARHGSGGVLFPSALLEYLFDLGKCEVAFCLAVIEMRRNANARLRTVIYQNLARQQFAAHLQRVRAIERNGSGPFFGAFCRMHRPAA